MRGRHLLPPLLLLAAIAGAGCVPDTNLFDERRGGRGGDAAPGATTAELVEPVAGAMDAPWNLAAVLVRFPAVVQRAVAEPAAGATTALGRPPLRLEDAMGAVISEGDLAAATCPGAGSCYRLPIGARLAPTMSYRVQLGDGIQTEGGDSVAAGLIGEFTTGTELDETPPSIEGLSFEPVGGCLRVRFSTGEPAEGRLIIRAGGIEHTVAAGSGLTSFDFAVPFAGMPPDVDAAAQVRVTDRSDNVAESAEAAIRTPAAGVPLIITEVLANAAGTEPGQELIEIKNTGSAAVALGGLSVDDASGRDVLPATAEIPAGAYAVVVPSSYDLQSDKDVRPRPGTIVLRVDTRLGGDGLANSGEVVRLRDAAGTIISSYGGWVDVTAAAWSGKSVHRVPELACDHPTAWTRKPLAATPGAPAP